MVTDSDQDMRTLPGSSDGELSSKSPWVGEVVRCLPVELMPQTIVVVGFLLYSGRFTELLGMVPDATLRGVLVSSYFVAMMLALVIFGYSVIIFIGMRELHTRIEGRGDVNKDLPQDDTLAVAVEEIRKSADKS